MGFLDSLFGKEEPDEVELSFGEVGDWLRDKQATESAKVSSEAQPILENVGKLLKEIRRGLQKLDSSKADGMNERIAKVVATSKPAYVESMLRSVDTLEEGLDKPPGGYSVLLKDELESIGKANFGDGRYLQLSYQQLMNDIQVRCKRLLEQSERLGEITGEGEYAALQREYDGIKQLMSSAEDVGSQIKEAEEAVASKESELKTLESDLHGAVQESEGEEVKSVRERVERAESALKSVEDSIHSHVGGLRRVLRKFTRHSPPDAKLISSLLDDPVAGFLKSDEGQFNSMMLGLKSAVESGRLKLKSREKSLAKVDEALNDLTPALRQEHSKRESDLSAAREAFDGIEVFGRRRRLEGRVESARTDLDGVRSDLSKLRSKLGETEAEVKKRKNVFADKMLEYGVRVLSG